MQRLVIMSVKSNTDKKKNFKHNFSKEINKQFQQMIVIYSNISLF